MFLDKWNEIRNKLFPWIGHLNYPFGHHHIFSVKCGALALLRHWCLRYHIGWACDDGYHYSIFFSKADSSIFPFLLDQAFSCEFLVCFDVCAWRYCWCMVVLVWWVCAPLMCLIFWYYVGFPTPFEFLPLWTLLMVVLVWREAEYIGWSLSRFRKSFPVLLAAKSMDGLLAKLRYHS